jgi:hypothetical protein
MWNLPKRFLCGTAHPIPTIFPAEILTVLNRRHPEWRRQFAADGRANAEIEAQLDVGFLAGS